MSRKPTATTQALATLLASGKPYSRAEIINELSKELEMNKTVQQCVSNYLFNHVKHGSLVKNGSLYQLPGAAAAAAMQAEAAVETEPANTLKEALIDCVNNMQALLKKPGYLKDLDEDELYSCLDFILAVIDCKNEILLGEGIEEEEEEE